MKKTNKIITFTIIAKNYYPQAQILTKSYKKYHPDHDFFVFFIDDDCIKSPYYQAIPLTQVDNIRHFQELSFKYNITEFATAVKPYIFQWLLKKFNPGKILYFDPDICFYTRADKIINELDTHDCILIPHRTQPTNDNKKPNEWDFMACGYYNLGFVGFKNSTKVHRFLRWWADKLHDYAFSDIKNFMFTDQKWMDYAPSFLDTFIIRDRGYDVAYWNLHQYIGKVSPNDIYFFHFSGFVPEKNILSKHQDRFSLDNVGDYKRLFSDYASQITRLADSRKDLLDYTYPYGRFDNGVEITPLIKEIYRQLTSNKSISFVNLFNTKPKNSFFSYLSKVVTVNRETKILNYFLLLNEHNFDIHKEFPLEQPYDLRLLNAYLNWSMSYGKSIYNTPDFFINNQKKLSANVSKFVFHRCIPLQPLETMLALETNKRNKNNSDFIISGYKIILHRNPDSDGYRKNLKDLNHFRVSRNLFLVRLFSSPEFFYKHGRIILNGILPYYLFLSALSLKYLIFDRYLQKLKIVPVKDLEKSSQNAFNLTNNLGCNVCGYLDTESGVGESARGIIRALNHLKIPLNLNNIEQPWLRRKEKTYARQFSTKSNHPINILCINADQTKAVIEQQLTAEYVKYKYNIGYWYWESDIFPDIYQPSFDAVNEVWTATTYVQQAISSKSPRPVICIPPAFTPSISKSIKPFNFAKFNLQIEKDDFVFLNLFDSASFWQRKNPFGLIDAFTKAFRQQKKFKLIIKTTQIKKTNIYPQLSAALSKNDQIILIDSYLSSNDLHSLLNRANCYVSLHKAEGLGIPLINAHLLGKPVISTYCSGNRDFETEYNTFTVDSKPLILKEAIGPYVAGTTWADPDIDHAIFQMRKIRDMDQDSLSKIALRGQDDITQHFSPQRIAELIYNRLKIINNIF